MSAFEEWSEQETHLKDFLLVVRKRLWLILTVVVVAGTIAAIMTFRQPSIYKATAQLIVEKQTPNILHIQEILQASPAYGDFYNTQLMILQSRTLAQSVADRLSLQEHPLFKGARDAAGSPPSAAAREGLVTALCGMITVELAKNSFIFNINVRSTDPRLAAQVANALVDVYIDQNLKYKVDTTEQAGSWLAEQSADARKKLAASEKALQRFNEQNNVVSLEDRQGSMSQKLGELSSELTKVRMERMDLELRLKQLGEQRQSAGTGPEAVTYLAQFSDNAAIQSLRTELTRHEFNLTELAKIYTPKHPKIVELVAQIQSLRRKLAAEAGSVTQGLENEYEIATKREENIRAAIQEQQEQLKSLNLKAIENSVIKREVESDRRVYDMLVSREKETDLLRGMRINNARLIDSALIPGAPESPNRPRSIRFGLLLGIIVGLGLAFFLEYFDDTVKDPEDLERYIPLPFLGVVPVLKSSNSDEHALDLLSLLDPGTAQAEAYRAVRTSLLFSSPDNPPRAFVITSAGPQEGKSLTAVNLAITMALNGNRVLLVDADLRKPRLHNVFGFPNTVGLSSLIGGEVEVGNIQHATTVPALKVITSGPIPPNPSELLGSERMHKLLESLREQYDQIVLDCTPLIGVSDAAVLSSRVDGVIMVVKAGATSRRIVRRCVKRLEDVQARIIGVVLNQLDTKKSIYYSSAYYTSGYYADKKSGGADGKQSPAPGA